MTRPCLLSQQTPSRTASDQQIRSSSKLHLQPYPQHTTTGAPRPAASQRSDTPNTTKSNKKSGFTLTSPAVAAQEVEDEGDSDEWISSESLSVTPQNQSSDSESGDESDDVVRKLPANLDLTGAAHTATSPDDREPPTPTVPHLKMQPPTPVNNVKEESRHRSSTTVPNEPGASAVVDDVDRHGRERTITSAADDHADTVLARHRSVGDCNYPHSGTDHHARLEEGLASTPRPRAMADRDTEPTRHLPRVSLSNPPRADSSAQKPPAANPRLSGGVQDRPHKQTLSTHSVPQSHPRIASDSSPVPRPDHNPQTRDQIAMTQVSQDPPVRITIELPIREMPPSPISLVRIYSC